MGARAAALAVVGLAVLASCTPATTPSSGPGSSAPPSASSTPTGTVASASASTSASSGPVATSTPPLLVVLSGTSIGGRPLGHADLKSVESMLVDRLDKPAVGQPQLCQANGSREAMAVIDHTWPGLTVRYGSTGAEAVAIAWTVDLTRVPEGFQLAGGLPWKTTFASLEKFPGVRLSTVSGARLAELSRLRITYSGPVGAARPDSVTGGATIICS